MKQLDLIDYIKKEQHGINVISLFNGMSVGKQSFIDLGIPVKNYYVSEIDQYANAVTRYVHPDHTMLGDVTKWQEWDINWSEIDAVIAGSPCQGFSFAGKQLNFDDPRSALFFEFVNIYNHAKKHNPKCKFFLENVRMKKEYSDVINNHLDTMFESINSSLLTAQNRNRYYWCQTPIKQPDDLGIVLADILQDDSEVDEKYYFDININVVLNKEQILKINKNGKIKKDQNKASCLTGGGNSGGNHSDMDLIVREATKKGYTEIKPGNCVDLTFPNSKTRRGRNMKEKSNCLTATNCTYLKYTKDYRVRRLTPLEWERLQGLPDNYTQYGINEKGKVIKISDTQRYKMLGNGWTLPVITHIFKQLFADKIINIG